MKHLLLTGKPGVGKTTLIKGLVEALRRKNESLVQGFYTEEVRVDGQRVGFDCVFFDGQQPCALARVNGRFLPHQRRYKVGKYSVKVEEFELYAVPSLRLKTEENCYVVVDEIGKMELLSARFKQAVSKLFEKPNITIIGSIPGGGAVPSFVESIRELPDVCVVEITIENRDGKLDELMSYLEI